MNDSMMYDKTLIDNLPFEKWLGWLSKEEKKFLNNKLKFNLLDFIGKEEKIQKRIMKKCMKLLNDYRINDFVVNDIFHLNNNGFGVCGGKCGKRNYVFYDDNGWDDEYTNPKYWN